jgi:hypothetical protein
MLKGFHREQVFEALMPSRRGTASNGVSYLIAFVQSNYPNWLLPSFPSCLCFEQSQKSGAMESLLKTFHCTYKPFHCTACFFIGHHVANASDIS